MEVPPDTQLVIGIYLPDRHPLVIRPDRSELSVREARARGRETTPNTGVVAVGGSSFPRLIGDFMIILPCRHGVFVEKKTGSGDTYPDGNPRPTLVGKS